MTIAELCALNTYQLRQVADACYVTDAATLAMANVILALREQGDA